MAGWPLVHPAQQQHAGQQHDKIASIWIRTGSSMIPNIYILRYSPGGASVPNDNPEQSLLFPLEKLRSSLSFQMELRCFVNWASGSNLTEASEKNGKKGYYFFFKWFICFFRVFVTSNLRLGFDVNLTVSFYMFFYMFFFTSTIDITGL